MAQELMNLLVNRIHNRFLRKYVVAHMKGKLIDIGCGNKPYRDLLAPYIKEHIGIEPNVRVGNADGPDIAASAYAIPLPSDSFDSVLCTAVLEHLEEPELALRESCRVLKPNGVAIYSVPFIWHLHEEPRDFYRFSKYGLSYLFAKTGFEIIELKALSGFWVTFGQLLVYNVYRLNVGPLRWLRVIDVLGLFVQGLAFLLDKMDRTEQWTWMYMVVARKKSSTFASGKI